MTRKKTASPFVKAAETKTPVANSKTEIDRLLKRYGASMISMSEDVTRRQIVVSFVVPDSGSDPTPRIPVRLPVSVFAVYDAMYGRPFHWNYNVRPAEKMTSPTDYNIARLEKAERTAWRNIVLWLDAALSAASIGLQTITESFFAHAVVGDNGTRMIEVVEQFQGQLGTGVQRLLTAPVESK